MPVIDLESALAEFNPLDDLEPVAKPVPAPRPPCCRAPERSRRRGAAAPPVPANDRACSLRPNACATARSRSGRRANARGEAMCPSPRLPRNGLPMARAGSRSRRRWHARAQRRGVTRQIRIRASISAPEAVGRSRSAVRTAGSSSPCLARQPAVHRNRRLCLVERRGAAADRRDRGPGFRAGCRARPCRGRARS